MPKVSEQDQRYLEAVRDFGAAVDRLARGYEVDADLRHDLRQEIHTAIWRSFARFDGRCSVRTWVFRVAHNTGASHILKRRAAKVFVALEELDEPAGEDSPEKALLLHQELAVLTTLIDGLKPTDRQIALLYLEDFDAEAIGEVTGLSAGAVAVKIHRLKAVLVRRSHEGGYRDR